MCGVRRNTRVHGMQRRRCALPRQSLRDRCIVTIRLSSRAAVGGLQLLVRRQRSYFIMAWHSSSPTKECPYVEKLITGIVKKCNGCLCYLQITIKVLVYAILLHIVLFMINWYTYGAHRSFECALRCSKKSCVKTGSIQGRSRLAESPYSVQYCSLMHKMVSNTLFHQLILRNVR